jgi:hypothetical protein
MVRNKTTKNKNKQENQNTLHHANLIFKKTNKSATSRDCVI